MKTLIYGAGPIGQWLALRLHQAGTDVTLLARGRTFEVLDREGIVIVDGWTGERMTARVPLVDRIGENDSFDLVVVAMQRNNRIDVCKELARNPNLPNVLFLGNDFAGFRRYFHHLPEKKVLLGFPGVGGGWRGNDLVIMDREKENANPGEIFIGEIDGVKRARTRLIGRLFEAAGIKVHHERDIDGWLKYHFAFMAPTAAAILEKGGDLGAVAGDPELIHRYCRACREAGDVLRKVGYHRRQPGIFNLYYWLPRWLEPKVFGKLFGSRNAEIRFGLHARSVGPELLDLADEFETMAVLVGMKTPTLDELLESVRRPFADVEQKELE
jgi:2-dehydropantoate 2-reductase